MPNIAPDAPEVPKRTSDEIHNRNSYQFLKSLRWSEAILGALPESIRSAIHDKFPIEEKYDPNFAYGNLYTQLFNYIDNQDNIDKIYQASPSSPLNFNSQLDNFFLSLFQSKNGILEQTYQSIREIVNAHGPASPSLQGSISGHVADSGSALNARTPAQAGARMARVKSVIEGFDFTPSHWTSLATRRIYRYNENAQIHEYRFGTQAQRINGIEQVSPVFKKYLSILQKQQRPNEGAYPRQISHVYFNNLGRDGTSLERKIERKLTNVLEALEAEHPNILVITLPADKGLMSHHAYEETKPTLNAQDVKAEFLAIAQEEEGSLEKIKDFHISPAAREMLFLDSESGVNQQEELLKGLIEESFNDLGLNDEKPLSPAQKQAVWFHFLKSRLPDFIINKLSNNGENRLGINFSCKDAIDRGGVSSAYYNLLQSFQTEKPMSRDEFEQALHAAPTMVKARGMNDHLNIIWNAVDAYVTQNRDALEENQQKAWLITWRDMNCPKARINDLLDRRCDELKKQLTKALESAGSEPPTKASIAQGINIIESIKKQVSMGMSGKRLLLEVAALTPDVILNPSVENLKRYEALSNQLTTNYPTLKRIGGAMKTVIGAIVYGLTLGHKSDLLKSGLATYRAGASHHNRAEMIAIMEHFKTEVQQAPGDSKAPATDTTPLPGSHNGRV